MGQAIRSQYETSARERWRNGYNDLLHFNRPLSCIKLFRLPSEVRIFSPFFLDGWNKLPKGQLTCPRSQSKGEWAKLRAEANLWLIFLPQFLASYITDFRVNWWERPVVVHCLKFSVFSSTKDNSKETLVLRARRSFCLLLSNDNGGDIDDIYWTTGTGCTIH